MIKKRTKFESVVFYTKRLKKKLSLFFVDSFSFEKCKAIFSFIGLLWSTLLLWYAITNSAKIEVIWHGDQGFFFTYGLFWIGLVIVIWKGIRGLLSFLEKVLVYPYLSAVFWLTANSGVVEKIDAGRIFVRRIFSPEELQWAMHLKYNHIDMYSIFARMYRWEDAIASSGGSLESLSSKVHEDFVHFWLIYYPNSLRPFVPAGGACLDPLGFLVVPFCTILCLWIICDTIQFFFLTPEEIVERYRFTKGLALNLLHFSWYFTIPWNEQMSIIQKSFYPSMEESDYKFEEYLRHSKESIEGSGYPEKLKNMFCYPALTTDGKKVVVLRDWVVEVRPVPLKSGWESTIPKGPK